MDKRSVREIDLINKRFWKGWISNDSINGRCGAVKPRTHNCKKKENR